MLKIRHAEVEALLECTRKKLLTINGKEKDDHIRPIGHEDDSAATENQ